MKYAFYENSFNNFVVGYYDEKVVEFFLIDNYDKLSVKTKFSDYVANQIDEYFKKKRTVFNIPLLITGTVFQKKVYNALLNIAYGQTKSYKEIAIEIDNPKAYRAVGMANHNNPIALIIPCHRVIASSNKIGGYAYGLEMKNRLLNLEGFYL
ncbi:MAG: methylated-DNA--[protein]-cysteine S-methyltransferase [Spirochaetia bacterium]|nr:methylated-DNA--[protein]-cysteine S-methyltransferase [Spirochaetia bacterium]